MVHGRNAQAHDAIFTFLRAVQQQPQEWSAIEGLSGAGSPNTYDVVLEGIEQAQCVVILFTGDDAVRLRPEYGNEASSFQPRPNVLLEAGFAYAKVGPERTVVCTFGDIRSISDLAGFLAVPLDNSAAARQRFVARLKSAGCRLDDTGSDFLRPETGGDFDLRLADLQPEKTALERGGFNEFVVDSSLSHTPNSQMLYHELCEYLKQGSAVDLKYNYIGTLCASHWMALSEDPSYGHSELQKTLGDHVQHIVDRCELNNSTMIDLVSLGPGDGIIDRALVHGLQARAYFRNYYPFDISFDLLQRSVAEVANTPWLFPPQGRKFGIKAIHGDFTELKRYRPIYGFDPSVNLFALVGYSLGNYNEAELLSKLGEGMNPGDYLLADARLHGIEGFRPQKKLGRDDKDKVLVNYRHSSNTRFAFGPVETATLIDARQVAISLDVTTSVTAVPHAVNIVTYCTNLATRFRHDYSALRRDRLNLALTTQYSYEALVEWLENRDLDLIWKTRVGRTGLFLLRKPNQQP